jgi:alkylation response protein AidB-like acyl-CoA dehydrogenase
MTSPVSALKNNVPSQPEPPPLGTEHLKALVQQLGPAIKKSAADVEKAARVPDSHIESLRVIGYFKFVQPREFGGMELGFDSLVDVNIELAKYCASTAWVSGLLAAHQWLVAGFPEKAQHEVWGENPYALVCGSYAPTVTAISAPGGYRLSGRWAFASGCDVATWSVCAAILPAGEAGPPRPAFLLVPSREYTIDNDWDVVGLAGTGSKTLILEDVFVPEHRVLTFGATVAGRTPGAALYSHNPEFSIPMLCNIPSCLASVAVGAASGALDDYIAMTSTRITRGAVAGSNSRMAEFPTIQLRIAEAAACADAAREVLLRDLKDHIRAVRAGRTIDVEQRIKSRRGQAFAVSLALRAAEALNSSTGGYGLAKSNPIQRAWRDVNAVGRHISMNWDAVGTMFGQMVLGLEPKGQY